MRTILGLQALATDVNETFGDMSLIASSQSCNCTGGGNSCQSVKC